MNFGQTFLSSIDAAVKAAGDALEFVADLVTGPGSTLRDGSEHDPVNLPRDLAAHAEAQTEWWYYTGHASTISGRRFGFELVFFKRRTDLDKFSIVPLRLVGNPYYFAHFAISDISVGEFKYAHRKSSNGPLDLSAHACEEKYLLRLGDWTAYESNGLHVVRATLEDGTLFEATLKPSKPVVLNGVDGVSFKDDGEASRYFSYTRMALEGSLTDSEGINHFEGLAWMDREFGSWEPTENQKGWDWFSIQLEDSTELMCYVLHDGKGNISDYSSGTFVYPDGRSAHLDRNSFSVEVESTWESPSSSSEYPSKWRIRVAELDIDLSIVPFLPDQELDTRGTTMIVYWEGACKVNGIVGNSIVTGNAYVELVGYDRSHDQPNLATFLLGNQFFSSRKA